MSQTWRKVSPSYPGARDRQVSCECRLSFTAPCTLLLDEYGEDGVQQDILDAYREPVAV